MEEHYSRVLSRFYTWSLIGDDFDAAVKAQQERMTEICPELTDMGKQGGATALDLGCGSGLHSLTLAKLGFSVRSVDLCQELLDEMKERAAELKLEVTPIKGDIMNPGTWSENPSDKLDVAVCMGDTLSHLSSLPEMEAMLASLRPRLKQDGALLLSYRDQQAELQGPARCIPVRSSPTRIHTCFLEFEPSHVTVNDIFHEFDADTKTWTQHVGGFVKLRITTEDVLAALEAAGYRVTQQKVFQGMTYICAAPSC